MIAASVVASAASEVTNTSLANTSSDLLWGSALVLALAMISFTIDLARAAGRSAKTVSASNAPTASAGTAADNASPASSAHASGAAQGGGSTAILTKERTRTTTASGDGVSDGRTGGPADGEPAATATVSRRWAGYAMMLSWLGTFLLVAAIVTRGLSVSRPPLGNMYEFLLAGSVFAMLVFLIWSLKQDVRWLGAFVTGAVVLFEMLAATIFYTAASQLMPSLRSYWLSIHVTVATISVGLFVVAFCLNMLYLGQAAREEGKLRRFGFFRNLPDSAALDRAGYGVLIIAFPLWTFTLIAGAIWAQEAWGHYWNWDPKEVWTLVIWVCYAAYLHARVTAGWSGRKATMIALAGFACVLINYGIVNLFFVGQHSYSGM